MSTFLLIDPSLRTIGGHNFEYAWVILEAAERAGYRPVLASQRRFRSLRALPPHWKVLPVLPTDTLDRWLPKSPNERCLARDVEGQLLPSPFDDGFPRSQRIAQGWHTARAGRRLARTSQAYARLFQQIEVHPRDVVFLPTLFPRDFLGLVRYLRAAPESRLLDWHVQFQFNFLDGREPDYARQLTAFDAMRRQFAAALREIPQHSIHFYCCTEEVAAQYNRLGVGHFQVLSYSIGREFSGPAVAGAAPRDAAEGPPKTPRPLRVTCAGGLRREKGKRQLSLLLEQLSPQQMASNGVQLRVQLARHALLRILPQNWKRHLAYISTPVDASDAPLVGLRHPLARGDYVQLVQSSDVGLFLYSSEEYSARCSSVLTEMLAAGVPTIVPAGCWLARQLADPLQDYLHDLRSHAAVMERVPHPDLTWTCGGSAIRGERTISFAGPEFSAVTQLTVPDGATAALIGFDWVDPRHGRYVHIRAEACDDQGRDEPEAWNSIVGPAGRPTAYCHVRLKGESRQLRLTFNSAYNDLCIQVANPVVHFLDQRRVPGGLPLARVGLVSADVHQVPALLQELSQHFHHYRETAQAYSADWRQRHAPQRTIETLMRAQARPRLQLVAEAA